MAEVKSAQADGFVEKPDLQYRTFLFYGPDSGLVSERADAISGRFGVDLADPFSLMRLDADTAAADRGRLADEAHTIGMFGGSRLIRVSGTTRRNLADAVKPVLDFPPVDSRIVIEAGDLKKDSALRRMVEKSKSGVAIPCYPDDDRAIERLIGSVVQQAGMTIDQEARELLKANLGADRKASRNELEKLVLYCHGKPSIGPQDVVAIVGDTAAIAADDAIDAALAGRIGELEDLSLRLEASGVSADMVLIQALRHVQTLHALRSRMAATKAPAAAAVAAMRPPVHFSRRDAMVRVLNAWPQDRLEKSLTLLDRAAFEARAKSGLAWSIAGRALLALALEGRRSRN